MGDGEATGEGTVRLGLRPGAGGGGGAAGGGGGGRRGGGGGAGVCRLRSRGWGLRLAADQKQGCQGGAAERRSGLPAWSCAPTRRCVWPERGSCWRRTEGEPKQGRGAR